MTTKSAKFGFTTLESLVVIAIMGALFFVLMPPVFYHLGWLNPPVRDVEFEVRDVEHPTAPRIPKGRDDQGLSDFPDGPE